MKKKFNLIYWIAILVLIYAVFSWIVPMADVSGGKLEVMGLNPIGLFELLYYPITSISSSISVALAILAIGGFYGVMVKTGVYSKMVEGLVKKVKGKEFVFLALTAITFSLLNALLGTPFALLIAVPFFMAVILKIGYSKLTAVTATIGALLVGSLGSITGTQTVGYVKYIFGFDVTINLFWKIALLVIATAILVYFIFTTTKKELKKSKKSISKVTKSTKSADKKEEKIVEKELKEEILFLDENVSTKKKSLSMIILFGVTIFFAIVSMYDWTNLLDIKIFDSILELINNVQIANWFKEGTTGVAFLENFEKLPIITTLFGVNKALGYWYYPEMITMLVIASLLIVWIYNLKFQDAFEGFASGAKKMLRPAIYVCFANIILTLAVNYGGAYSYYWIAENILKVTDFNALTTFLTSVVGSVFYNDFYFLTYAFGELLPIINYSSEVYPFIVFILQATHGLAMLLLPTSVILVSGLAMLDVQYRDWIKHIWVLLLELLITVLVFFGVFAILFEVL